MDDRHDGEGSTVAALDPGGRPVSFDLLGTTNAPGEKCRCCRLLLNTDPTGTTEVLAMVLAGSESRAGWQSLLDDRTSRGMHHVDLVVTDGDEGLLGALSRPFHTPSGNGVSRIT